MTNQPQRALLQTVNELWTKKYGFGRKYLQWQLIQDVSTFVMPADAVEPVIIPCDDRPAEKE